MLLIAPRRVLFENKSEPRSRIPRLRSRNGHQRSLARLSPSRYQELDGHDFSRPRVLPQKLDSPSCKNFYLLSSSLLLPLYCILSRRTSNPTTCSYPPMAISKSQISV